MIARTSLALACALLLAACAQRSDNFIEQIVREGVSEIFDEPAAAAPQVLPSRQQLEDVPGPLLAINFQDVGTGFVVGVNATPDGYVTFQDQTRRSVIVRGALVTGLQGFRYDLSWVKTQRDDPVVYLTPPAIWPKSLFRSYRFSLQSADDYDISVECRLTPIVQERIVVFEQGYDVTQIQEDCWNDRRQFTNTYWAETETGVIWQSRQWLGPNIRPATLQVIRPYATRRVTD